MGHRSPFSTYKVVGQHREFEMNQEYCIAFVEHMAKYFLQSHCIVFVTFFAFTSYYLLQEKQGEGIRSRLEY